VTILIPVDGDLITADPLQKIIDRDVKSDVGFYLNIYCLVNFMDSKKI